MWNHPTRASIYVNFIRVPPAKTCLHSLTKFHSPLLILSCPNQFVPEKCGFLYLSKVSVLHLCRIHSAVRCRCAQIAISKQCGNHARQYPTWNSWTHYLVVWPWAVSECDIEEHKSVARCLGDWMIFPKATWALVEDDHTRGRPSLIRIMRTNMFISSSKIGVELIRWTERCVSAHIVQRHLVAAGYHSRSPARCPKHTHDQHCQSRIWAPRYQKWNHQHWSLVIFADESRFWLYNCDGRAHIRQPHGERLVDCCIQKKGGNSSPSLMVWGAFHASGKSELVVVDGTVNQQHYISILPQKMSFPGPRQLSKKNTARNTCNFLAGEEVEVMQWPAQSLLLRAPWLGYWRRHCKLGRSDPWKDGGPYTEHALMTEGHDGYKGRSCPIVAWQSKDPINNNVPW